MFMYRKGLFRKYMIAFFVCFLIPLVVLSIFMVLSLYRTLDKEIKTYNENLVKQVSINAEYISSELLASGNKLRFNRYFQSDVLELENQLQVVRAIMQENEMNEYISQIYLLYLNKDIAFSSRGTYPPRTLMAKNLGLDEAAIDPFILETAKIYEPVFNTIQAEYINGDQVFVRDKLLCVYPVRTLSNVLIAHLIFEVNTAKLNQALSLGSGEMFWQNVFVLNSDYECLTGTNDQQLTASISKELSERVNMSEQVGAVELAGGFRGYYHIISNKQLIIVNLTDTTPLFSNLFQENKLRVLLVCVFSLLGLTMSVIISMRLYMPIQALSRHVGGGAKPGEPNANELQYIQVQFDKVNDMRQSFSSELERQWPLVEEHMMNALIYLNISDMQENDLIYNLVKQQILGRHYTVICVSLAKEPDGLRKVNNAGKSFANAVFGGEYMVYSIYLRYYKALAMLLMLDSPEKTDLEMIRGKIVDYCKAHNPNDETYIGIGGTYEAIEDIRTSFLEAITLMRRQILKLGDETLNGTSDAAALFRHDVVYQDILANICGALKAGDGDKAESLAGELLQILKTQPGPIYITQMTCYNIINTVIRVVGKMDVPVNEAEVFRTINSASVEGFVQNLSGFLRGVCENMQKMGQASKSQLCHAIESYIKVHFKDSSLSLTTLADAFGFSPSYASKYITQNFNASFSDLVTDRRMEYIKKELRESDRQIAAIAEEAGYSNISNFMRRFKAMEGMTPGRYRELNTTR